SQGSLTGAGVVLVTGSFVWQGGVLGGTGTLVIAAQAVLQFSGDGTDGRKVLTDGRTIQNNSTMGSWTGNGGIWAGGTSTFNNLSGSVLNASGPGDIFHFLGGTPAFVVGAGALFTTACTLGTRFEAGVTFTNLGLVRVLSAALTVAGTYTQMAGETVVQAG